MSFNYQLEYYPHDGDSPTQFSIIMAPVADALTDKKKFWKCVDFCSYYDMFHSTEGNYISHSIVQTGILRLAD